MSNSAIDKLKSTLGIGARTNKYKVIINGVLGGPSGEIIDTLAKSASIPSVSFNEIEVWNQGRLTTIAGDISYAGTWTVTFIDDEEHTLRGKFIKWAEAIDNAIKHSSTASSHSSYMSTAELHQLSTIDNSVKAKYKFDDVWPKNISESAMSDETSDMVEFTVEFNYTTWSKY